VHLTERVLLCGKPMANIMDSKPMVNIKPFGQCSSLANPVVAAATSANYGRLQKMPCIPNIPFPWLNGKMNLIIKGSQALLSTSKCTCVWAATIEVADPGQNTVREDGPMNITITEPTVETQQALGGGLLPEQGGIVNQAMDSNAQTQISPNIVISQNTETNADAAVEAVTVTSTQQISVVSVKGVDKAFSKQELRYKVTSYKKGQSMVSADSIDDDIDRVRSEIKWAVKVGECGETIVFEADNEERYGITYENQCEIIVFYEIPDAWADKDIFVSARIEGSDKEASYKTNICPLSQMLLIRKVEGEEYAFSGQKLIYKVTGTNKDMLDDGDKNRIKWAIKVEGIDPKTLKKKNEMNITGDNLTLGIKKEHIDGGKSKITVRPYLNDATEGKSVIFTIENGKASEIIVMPHLNSPTEIVSVKTHVYTSLGSKIIEMLREMHRDGKKEQKAIFNSNQFVEELIEDIENNRYGINTGWLKEIKEANCRIEVGNQLKSNGNKLENGTFAQIGIVRYTYTEEVIIQINLNHNFFTNKTGLSGGDLQKFDKQLQILLFHEFVHAWQEKTNDWTNRIMHMRKKIQKRIQAPDGTMRTEERINIYTEIEAYDLQFEYEKKINRNIIIDTDIVNQIRNNFKKVEDEEAENEVNYSRDPKNTVLTTTAITILSKKAHYLLSLPHFEAKFAKP